jgi:hypothetical protein
MRTISIEIETPLLFLWSAVNICLQRLSYPHFYTTHCRGRKFYMRFETFAVVTMKNVIFWDIKTQFVSQETHYMSATEPSRLMLRKISGSYGRDYEECRILGFTYKTQFLPHRKHYVSATEPSLLMLCKIRGGDWGMPRSRMQRRVDLVRTNVLEEHVS